MAKTPIDPEMVKRTNVPATPEQLAATAESRRSAALQAVQQQEAQRASRAQAANTAQRAAWAAEGQAQAKAAMQPRQPSVPPLPRDWKPEQRPLSIQPGTMQPSGPSGMAQVRPSGPSRAERLQQNIRDAEVTFREGKFLGMAPPEWVTNRPSQMDPNRSAVEQMTEYLGRQPGIGQQQMPQQPGGIPQGSPSPNRPPVPMGLGDMSQGQQPPMGLGEGGQALPFRYDPNEAARQYEREQAMSSPAAMQRSTEYEAAKESLRKAAANVAADPRFSPEQRTAAFERIRAKIGELDANFAEGQDLMQSPTGFDQPPPEEFGLLQPGGLQPIGGGQLRNPDTGDILETVRGPNGEVLPVNLRQPEIDALPPGTRYLDQAGKVQIAGEGGGRRGGGAAPAARGGRGTEMQEPGTFASQEEAFSAYEKWAAKQDPGSTGEEKAIIEQIISSVQDPAAQEKLRSDIEMFPERTAELLQQNTQLNVVDALEGARIKEFSKQQKSRSSRAKQLAQELGFETEEDKGPTVDPNRYFVETGTRGTTQIKRRGSSVAIPGVYDANGDLRAAPATAQQLVEIEPNTEFLNIRPAEGGREVRVIPFGGEMHNTGDFALTNADRKRFANETAQIRPRDPAEWKAFEDSLSQFAAVNEPWSPDTNAGQRQLEKAVHMFYSELGPAGKAAMTMHIAHALGHRIDPTKPFKSTGWAGKKILEEQTARQSQTDAAAQQRSPDRYRSFVSDQAMPSMLKMLEGGDESAFDRQAFQAVSGLATAIELQNPSVRRGSPEFQRLAEDAIDQIVSQRTRMLPPTSTSTVNESGGRVQGEIDSAAVRARENMLRIRDRLREGFGIREQPAPAGRAAAAPSAQPAEAAPPAEPMQSEQDRQRGITARREQFARDQEAKKADRQRAFKEEQADIRRRFEAEREAERRAPDIEQRRLYDEAIGRQQAEEEKRQQFRSQLASERARFESQRETERAAPDVRQGAMREQRLAIQRLEKELEESEKYINMVGATNAGRTTGDARRLRAEIARKKKELEEAGRYRETSR